MLTQKALPGARAHAPGTVSRTEAQAVETSLELKAKVARLSATSVFVLWYH
jgi:hypothetical protein